MKTIQRRGINPKLITLWNAMNGNINLLCFILGISKKEMLRKIYNLRARGELLTRSKTVEANVDDETKITLKIKVVKELLK